MPNRHSETILLKTIGSVQCRLSDLFRTHGDLRRRPLVLFHVGSQERINSCLISRPLFLVPLDDVAINAQRQLLLAWYYLEVSASDSTSKHFGSYLRNV